MLLKLDFQSEVPIYAQLKAQIVEGIATGRLASGEALPSVRQMASDLGINLHTVNKTYSLLKQDGFIIVHRQKGVVVNPDTASKATGEYMSTLNERLRPIVSEALCRGVDIEEFNGICSRIYAELKKGEGGDMI